LYILYTIVVLPRDDNMRHDNGKVRSTGIGWNQLWTALLKTNKTAKTGSRLKKLSTDKYYKQIAKPAEFLFSIKAKIS